MDDRKEDVETFNEALNTDTYALSIFVNKGAAESFSCAVCSLVPQQCFTNDENGDRVICNY